MYCYVNNSVSRTVKQATMVELQEISGKSHQECLQQCLEETWYNENELTQMRSAVKTAIMTGKLM
jgi:hypothetical protein